MLQKVIVEESLIWHHFNSDAECLGAVLHTLQCIDDQLAKIMLEGIEPQLAVH